MQIKSLYPYGKTHFVDSEADVLELYNDMFSLYA